MVVSFEIMRYTILKHSGALFLKVIVVGKVFGNEAVFNGEDRTDGQLKSGAVRGGSGRDKFNNNVLVTRRVQLKHFIVDIGKHFIHLTVLLNRLSAGLRYNVRRRVRGL